VQVIAGLCLIKSVQVSIINRLLILLSGELLAERCRTDDLIPSIPVPCLLPSRVDPNFWDWTSSSITLSQVDLGRPGGLRQSGGGRIQ